MKTISIFFDGWTRCSPWAAMAAVMIILFNIPLVYAQTQVSGPAVEFQRNSAWVGDWIFEEERTESLLGPAEKVTEKYRYEFTLDGFFLIAHGESHTPSSGESRIIEVFGYDPEKGTHTWIGFTNKGEVLSTTPVWKDNVCTGVLEQIVKGKPVKTRGTFEFTSHTSMVIRREISVDGGPWSTYSKGTGRKIAEASTQKE